MKTLKQNKRIIFTLSAWLLSATLLNVSTACAANIAGYGSGGQGNIIALGNGAAREGVGTNYKIEERWTTAIGNGAHTYPKKHSKNWLQTSPQEYYLRFGASNEALPGEIAIGNYTFARTGTIQIGSERFVGTMGDITMTVNAATGTTNHSAPYSVVDTTVVGTNSYHSSVMGVMLGSYSVTTGTDDNKKNFASVVIGSLNSIRSASGSSTDGVASSVIGIANVAEKSNGTLIFGAGNKVVSSSSKLSLSESSFSSYAGRANVDNVANAAATIVKNNQGGGAALVVGGGNEAEYVQQSQIFGTNNTMAGTGTSTNALSRWNSVAGTNNALTSVSDTLVIGRNRTLKGVSHDIIIGATAAQTETAVSRAGSYGHEANVYAPGGVALGHSSIADRGGFTVDTTPPFSGELYQVNLNGVTDGAVSIAGKAPEQQRATKARAAVAESSTLRQVINLGDGTEDTDAVNLRQLRGGLSFEVISGGESVGTLEIGDSAPKFEAGAGLLATVNEDTIVFALNTDDEIFDPEGALKGETGDPGEDGKPGENGENGKNGQNGPNGENGKNGRNGLNGKDGKDGAQGPTGPQGETGDAGAQGAKGDKGDTGDAGSKGDKGDTGDAGPKGEKGETGTGSSGGGSWSLQANGDTADEIKDGDTVQFKSGSNVSIARAKTDVTIGLVDAPTFKGRVTAKGFDASGEKITNVAPGTVSQSSTDAVNGSQLWGYSSSAAKALGGGSTVNSDGTITAPTYTVAGNNYSTVGDAFSALDRRFDSFRSETGALHDEIKGTSALNAALAGLKPIHFDPIEPSQIMFSVGNYRDKWACALGMAHYVREDFMVHAGVAFGESSRTLVKAGFTVKLGRDEDEKEKNSKIFGRYSKQPLTSVTLLRKENDSLHAQIDALERENAAAQARLETLERRLYGTRQ